MPSSHHSSPDPNRAPDDSPNCAAWSSPLRLPSLSTPLRHSSDLSTSHQSRDDVLNRDPSYSTALNPYEPPSFEPAFRDRRTSRELVEAGTKKLPTVAFADLPELIFKSALFSGVFGHMCFSAGKAMGQRLQSILDGDPLSPLGRTCMIFDTVLFGGGVVFFIMSGSIFIESFCNFSSSVLYPVLTREGKSTAAPPVANSDMPT